MFKGNFMGISFNTLQPYTVLSYVLEDNKTNSYVSNGTIKLVITKPLISS